MLFGLASTPPPPVSEDATGTYDAGLGFDIADVKMAADDPAAPFIDRAGYLRYIDRGEERFRKALADQEGRR